MITAHNKVLLETSVCLDARNAEAVEAANFYGSEKFKSRML